MPQTELGIDRLDGQEEDARLEALASTGILDTAPEANFDAITRLAAEYFKADTVLLGFADESRVWVRSTWASRCGSCLDSNQSLSECWPRMAQWWF